RAGLTTGLGEPGTRTRVDGRGDPARWGEASAGDAGEDPDGTDDGAGEDAHDGDGAGPGTSRRAEDPLRRSATSEAGALLADLVERDVQTLVFARSRRGAELVAGGAKRLLEQKAEQAVSPRLAER